MSNYTELKNTLKAALGNVYFTLDDGEQSFNVYLTQHINLCDDWIGLEVAKSVYGKVKNNDQIVENIKEIYDTAKTLSEDMSVYVSVNVTDCEHKPFNLAVTGMEGVYEGDLEVFHYATVADLVEGIKTFSFEA